MLNYLNCLIAKVRFDNRKTIRRGNHNMRYEGISNMDISNMK